MAPPTTVTTTMSSSAQMLSMSCRVSSRSKAWRSSPTTRSAAPLRHDEADALFRRRLRDHRHAGAGARRRRQRPAPAMPGTPSMPRPSIVTRLCRSMTVTPLSTPCAPLLWPTTSVPGCVGVEGVLDAKRDAALERRQDRLRDAAPWRRSRPAPTSPDTRARRADARRSTTRGSAVSTPSTSV